MEAVRQNYEKRKHQYNKLLDRQKKTEAFISNIRLAVFMIGAAAAAFLFIRRNYVFLAAVLVVFIAVFVIIAVKHGKLINRMKYTTALLDINHKSLQRLNGEWKAFEDKGEDFVDDHHSYSGDLDIFGKSSLFQWINTANTYVGRSKLAQLLSGSYGTNSDINQRQGAVDELALMLNWRQRFIAEGMVQTGKMHDPKELIAWAEECNEWFRKPWVIAVLRICPVITVLLVLTGLIMGLISWHWPVAALLVQYGLLSYKAKERLLLFAMNERYNKDLKIYYNMLKLVETRTFHAEYINTIKNRIKSDSGLPAFKQIDKLSSIVDSISDRKNAFYFFYNILTLWDFQSIIALEDWKRSYGGYLQKYFDVLGSMEAISSMAVIRHDNPHWTKPVVLDREEAVLEANAMGHPLLYDKRVHNSLSIDGNRRVMLITGSNMSGKSTLLRTAGINLVLAYAGAPVCAEFFRASMMQIHSCMRVKDDLEQSISSFYAELLRIKEIVKEAKSGKQLFYLLDEIFKGTNSHDRHTGARVLINHLSLTNSIGMVSTHDLELCDLEDTNPRIANYHFKEYYEDGKICFDYKLQKGPSTTRNALYLMQLAGIEVEEISSLSD